MEDNVGTAIPGEAPPASGESQEASAPEGVTSAEINARALGWRPQEEFRGDPEKWVDAQTFIERGEQVMPLLKAQNKKLKREMDEIKATLKEFKDHTARVQNQELNSMLETIRRLKTDAISRGDGEAVVALEDQQAQILTQQLQAESAKHQPQQPQFSQEDQNLARQWHTHNSWYGKDQELTRAVDAIGAQIMGVNPEIDKGEMFHQIDSLIRRQFPNKFTRASSAAPVDAGRAMPRTGAKSYANLPADAKAACDRQVKAGMLTKEEYVKYYEWEK